MSHSTADRLLNRFRRLAQRELEPLSDRALLERFARDRDQEAFRALVRRHGNMVQRVCRRTVGHWQDAEEAFQGTFLVLARKAGARGWRDSIAGWLHQVAYRLSLRARANAARRRRLVPAAPVGGAPEPAAELSARELLAALDEELSRLPEKLRAPLILCYLEGATRDEAARLLRCPLGTLKSRVDRGRELLRERLAARGLSFSALLSAALLAEGALDAATLDAVVDQAIAFAATGGGLFAGGGPTAVGLAHSLLRTLLLKQAAVAAVTLLAAGLMAIAIGGLVLKSPSDPGAGPARTSTPTPAAPEPAQAARPGVDRLGDPLPPDAIARLGSVRFRHGAGLRAVAFAPDGRSLASGGFDGHAHVWDAATGKELMRLEPEAAGGRDVSSITSLAFLPDGKQLVVGRNDTPPCLYEVATSKKLLQVGSRSVAEKALFSPDGKTIIYGGNEIAAVRLADARTGADLLTFPLENGPATALAFASDGKAIAVADGKALQLFGIDGKLRRSWPIEEGDPEDFAGVAFSPDGQTLAAASKRGKRIQLFAVGQAKPLLTIPMADPREAPTRVLFAIDGKTLITGHDGGMIRFWDVANGAKLREIRAHWGTVMGLALAPDGKTLASVSNSSSEGYHSVRLWGVATGKLVHHPPGPQSALKALAFASDGRRVATSSYDGATLWEARTGQPLAHWDAIGPLVFTPDGLTVIGGGWSDGKLRFFDVATRKETRQFQADPKKIWSLALSADGKTLATAGGAGLLRLWELGTMREVRAFGEKVRGAFRLALSSDGLLLASAHFDAKVRLWDTRTGEELMAVEEPEQPGALAFSPDGKLLATSRMRLAGEEALIRLWDTATRKEVRQLRCGDWQEAIAFSPDGRALISGGQHRSELLLWEVASGQLRRKFSGHQGHLTRVAFSPDGRRIASGSADATALLWDPTGARDLPAPLAAPELERLWGELAADDAAFAYRAMTTLRSSPRETVGFLKVRLRPAAAANAERVAAAVRDLGAGDFRVRTAGDATLREFGEAAEPALREALAAQPAPEVRRGVEALLLRLEPAWLRENRALETLEWIAGPGAGEVLKALAEGAPLARLTEEARAGLGRVARQTNPPAR